MLFNKKTLFIVLPLMIAHAEGLVTLRSVDNDILKTEAIIRNVTNKLFFILKLTKIKERPKLKKYALVHNNLMSIALQEYRTLNEITKLTNVKIDNVTNSFMTELNALLDGDNKINNNTGPVNTDEDVVKDIDNFLTKLNDLVKIYGVNKVYNEINSDVINHLSNTYDLSLNESWNSNQSRENDILLDDNEFWNEDFNKDTLLSNAILTEHSGRRIFRGQRSKIKYFPFMAVILFFNKFQCAGSIIKSDLVITASSCLQLAWNNRFFRENPAFLSVRIGSNFYNGGGEVISVMEVYFHPNYNPKNLRNNLCILRLIRRINFRKVHRRVKKIDFDRHDSLLPENTDGITIIGWGSKTTSNLVNDPWFSKISYSVLDIYGLPECQEIYTKEYVTKKNFCAGFVTKGGGACNRDVGGPGIVHGILMGVISFGSPICGASDAPTVFTKLGYYTDWIEEIMEQDVPVVNARTTIKYTPDVWNKAATEAYTTTTFKLEPLLPEEMAKISIFDSENESFRNFLKTMFNSKEIKEFHEYVEEEIDESQLKTSKHNITAATEPSTTQSVKDAILRDNKYTKMEDFDEPTTTEESNVSEKNNISVENVAETTVANTKARKAVTTDIKTKNITNGPNATDTTIADLSDTDDISDTDIMRLLDKIDFKDFEDNSHQKIESDDEFKDSIQNINKSSILTLLYLSESEKPSKTNTLTNDLEGDGLSIPSGIFKDMTYRNNGTLGEDIYDFLSKDELYDILNEAIQSEVDPEKNKSNK